MQKKPKTGATFENGHSAYKHSERAVHRPDVGFEAQFSQSKPPVTYRYDSSFAPELTWDENCERDLAEWLLEIVTQAMETGEEKVFAKPMVWKGTGESFHSIPECLGRIRKLTKPFLNWTGKAETGHVTVPTMPLFVHERHSTQAILQTLKDHRARSDNNSLFGDDELDVAYQFDAYEHMGSWTNRLILGDSLQVTNSLLEYEGMGGQVQMIYFDPPYGIKYGSNFQPFVKKPIVRNGNDDQMIREPEMVKAYRDTWELGIHSYLTYLRDRLTVSKELLAPEGSIFVQISDDNLHHVRSIMDEVFGEENYVAIISFRTKIPLNAVHLAKTCDFLIWYARDKSRLRFHKSYVSRDLRDDNQFDRLELKDGSVRSMTKEEKRNPETIPTGARAYRHLDLTAAGFTESCHFEFRLENKTYTPPRSTNSWKTNPQGMANLISAGRISVPEKGEVPRYKFYFDDYPVKEISNQWVDTMGSKGGKLYAVQTTPKVIERCLHMTTDPGDLVVDITCGSGTTPVVCEKWGRRWIAVDTARVPIALARQRLLTLSLPWYELKDTKMGPAGGFVYERKQKNGRDVGGIVPHVTLGSIAQDVPPDTVKRVDRPKEMPKVTRVCGPFTVEGTIQSSVDMSEAAFSSNQSPPVSTPRDYLDRMISVLHNCKTIQLPGNVNLSLDNISPSENLDYIHAECIVKNDVEKRFAVIFGPEDSAVTSDMVFHASQEAMLQGFDQLLIFGFAIHATARAMCEKSKIRTTYVNVALDVLMGDLLKTTKSSQILSVTGLPDITLERLAGTGEALFRVSVKGLDVFNPEDETIDQIDAKNLPCWMLDTNYNERCFYATQVFFPKTGKWDDLRNSLGGWFDESAWVHLAGTTSAPFALGDKKKIAVRVVDSRGNENIAVRSESEAE